jgi:hypothetical protein
MIPPIESGVKPLGMGLRHLSAEGLTSWSIGRSHNFVGGLQNIVCRIVEVGREHYRSGVPYFFTARRQVAIPTDRKLG